MSNNSKSFLIYVIEFEEKGKKTYAKQSTIVLSSNISDRQFNKFFRKRTTHSAMSKEKQTKQREPWFEADQSKVSPRDEVFKYFQQQ